MTEKFDEYYSDVQRAELKARAEAIGPDRIRHAETEWTELIQQVRAEMDKGADPGSEPVRRLARRYQGLIDEFTGGDKEIEKSLGRMYAAEPDIAADKGFTFDPELAFFVGKALAAQKSADAES